MRSLFAGSIGHDLKNVLTVILGNLQLVQLDIPAGSPAAYALAQAEQVAYEGAVRILTLLQRIRATAVPHPQQVCTPEPFLPLRQFAGSVSYELGLILSAIRAHVQHTQRELPSGSPVTDALALVELAVARSCAMLETLVQIRQWESPPRTPHHLNAVLADVAAMIPTDRRGCARITYTFSQGLPVVVINPVQIQQIALNLILLAASGQISAPQPQWHYLGCETPCLSRKL
jgi:signal transduction histidine kinase